MREARGDRREANPRWGCNGYPFLLSALSFRLSQNMKLGLKVDVVTPRGAREGVPRLVELLTRHHAGATFFYTLGRDHLFGQTWLPGSNVGRRCANEMRAARSAGFEAGIHAFDDARWRRAARDAGAAWTRREMQSACERFQEIFGEPALTHGAADWQMNRHAYRLTQRLGFRYSSDTRGVCPFVPVCNAEVIACPQLPTTLPVLDELIGFNGVTTDTVADHVLRLSAMPPPGGHVYTLRAEIEGVKLTPVFDKLLIGWRAQGYVPVALRDLADDINVARLPRHCVIDSNLPGRARTVARQGREFLS